MYPIAHDLAAAATAAVRQVGMARTVIVEESPDWPGELIFQAGDTQGFYDRFGDWISRYMVLNQLFALRSFHDLIVEEGWLPVYDASCEPILERFETWDDPLTIPGFDCPYGGELYPFQTFTLNRALHRALWGKTAQDRLFFCNWTTGSGKTLFATAGAQELFNRGAIDLVLAFTLMASKLNLATDAVASFARTTNLRAVVNDGDKRKRQAVYGQEAKGYRNHPQVFVMNYEKAWADFEDLKKLVKGRRVLWIFDEAAKVLKATGHPTKTRAHLMKLVRASRPIVWPMSATVVDASPLRYWDVYNLTGRPQETNPLGDRAYFRARYARFASIYIPDEDIEWSTARLHEIRHKVADRTQAVRKTDPGVREHFKGMQHEETTIHLSDSDRKLYELIQADARDVIEETPEGERPKITGHARLLQYVTNIPTALNVSTDEAAVRIREAHPELIVDTHCAKLEYFLDQVEAIRDQGDKVVAFTRYTNLGMLLMAPHVAKRNIDHVLHYGVGQKPHERQAAQQRFKTDPHCTLFLSSDAGSHGLNLPEARYVINYDCPRSYDLLMQRSERINRADSQLDGMTSYVYITEDSLEELIWEENVRRRLLAQATMGTVETLDYGVLISEENDPHRLIFGKKAS